MDDLTGLKLRRLPEVGELHPARDLPVLISPRICCRHIQVEDRHRGRTVPHDLQQEVAEHDHLRDRVPEDLPRVLVRVAERPEPLQRDDLGRLVRGLITLARVSIPVGVQAAGGDGPGDDLHGHPCGGNREVAIEEFFQKRLPVTPGRRSHGLDMLVYSTSGNTRNKARAGRKGALRAVRCGQGRGLRLLLADVPAERGRDPAGQRHLTSRPVWLSPRGPLEGTLPGVAFGGILVGPPRERAARLQELHAVERGLFRGLHIGPRRAAAEHD